MAVRPGNEEPVHRAWLSLGKRLLRILQRQAQGRMFERRDLLQPEGGPDGHRKLAQSLQYQAPTFCARISATGTAHHRANARPDSQYELVSQLAWYKISVRPWRRTSAANLALRSSSFMAALRGVTPQSRSTTHASAGALRAWPPGMRPGCKRPRRPAVCGPIE